MIKDCNNETEFDVDGWCEEHFRMLFLDSSESDDVDCMTQLANGEWRYDV